MQHGKNFLIDLVKKQKGCEFSLRFLLQKEQDSWKNCFTMLKLVKKGTKTEINYDYGKYVLGEKLLGIEEGKKLISDLYPINGKNGKMNLLDYGEFEMNPGGESDFAKSNARFGIQKNQYPIRYAKISVIQSQGVQRSDRELLKEGFPYYPNLIEAVISFFELGSEHFSSFSRVYVIIPDYRAKIEYLKLSFSKAEVSIVNPEIEHEDLVVKIFAKSGTRQAILPDIYPKSEVTNFDVGFQPEWLCITLVSRPDNMKIDTKEFNNWSTEEEGVFVERPEDEIISLSKAGESQTLEYKFDILDENNKNDFIETVVAFLNTNRGIILVGVDDNGNIIGSTKNKEDLEKLIHDCIESPPKDVKIDEKAIDKAKIIIVEVPEGDDKPYQSKRDKNWYVRHNGSDMRMERSELFQMLEKYLKEGRVSPPY